MSGDYSMNKPGKILHMVHYIAECLFSKNGYRLVRCPVCGWLGCDSYYICPNCSWEYDGSNLYPYEEGGPNKMNFNEYKRRYDAKHKRTRNKEF